MDPLADEGVENHVSGRGGGSDTPPVAQSEAGPSSLAREDA